MLYIMIKLTKTFREWVERSETHQIIRNRSMGFGYRLSATAPALLYLWHPCNRTHPLPMGDSINFYRVQSR